MEEEIARYGLVDLAKFIGVSDSQFYKCYFKSFLKAAVIIPRQIQCRKNGKITGRRVKMYFWWPSDVKEAIRKMEV